MVVAFACNGKITLQKNTRCISVIPQQICLKTRSDMGGKNLLSLSYKENNTVFTD